MKKLLSVLLACIMLACMLPTFAFAEDPILCVGGVGVTEANAADIKNSSTITGGTVSYDADNNMLTLNGATITGTGSGIYYTGSDQLTIKLVGENKIINCAVGFNTDSSVALTGTGSLVVTCSTQATYRVPITDATITASKVEDGSNPVTFDPANINTYKYLNFTAVRKEFPLTKAVSVATGYDHAGETISGFNTLVSGVDAVFAITPYRSFNRQTGKTAIPAFSQTSYTIPLSTGASEINIETPNFADYGVGDYWYTVTENAIDNVAGITIDTTATRYLHIQVEWDSTTPPFTALKVAAVTLHNTAPNETTGTYTNDSGDKTTGFTNTYGAGELAITKKVTGNMGDPNKLFKVTVTFTAPDGKTVKSPISYTGGYDIDDNNEIIRDYTTDPGEIDADWTDPQTVTLYLKHDSTVTFSNIPDGVTYAIEEADYSGDGYTTTYEVTDGEADDTVTTTGVTGKISDSLDTVTITNNKTVAIDVGVTLDNAPFVLLLVGSIAFLALCFVLKRRKEEA